MLIDIYIPLQLEICDVIAPFVTDYPENIDPDQALLEEDQ